jgi:hypothetical protein
MEDFIIQYQGFSPSQFAEIYVRKMMMKVHDEAPSSSHLRVMIHRIGESAFRGVVSISSHAGPFVTIAQAPSVVELAQLLVVRVRRQLERWKSKRFSPRAHRAAQKSEKRKLNSESRDVGSGKFNQDARNS